MPGKFIIAAAGARKTSSIIDEALEMGDKRILITTYTNENVDQITEYLVWKNGHVPPNITIYPWVTFLLRECARPYQSFLSDTKKIKSVNFIKPIPFAHSRSKRSDVDNRYFDSSDNIFSDYLSDFVVCANDVSGGLVVKRLDEMYDYIFIDEVQDMAGYDLDFIESLMSSVIQVTAVGDPRQSTFSTNGSTKNRPFNGDMVKWVEHLKIKGVCEVEVRVHCHRCNQKICDFADALYPHYDKTVSLNKEDTGHDGIFFITPEEVQEYYERFNPVVLRYNKTVETLGLPAANMGASKGRTYERVLIFPTSPMKKYFKTQNILDAGDLPKFYVAITRAKFSVAFVK